MSPWWPAIFAWLIAAVFALGIGPFPERPFLATLRWLATLGAIVVGVIVGLLLVGIL